MTLAPGAGNRRRRHPRIPEDADVRLHHSEQTHQELIERLPTSTGTPLTEWLERLKQGPSLLRFDERVNWLRDEHELSHGFATAVVHEHDLQRGKARMS